MRTFLLALLLLAPAWAQGTVLKVNLVTGSCRILVNGQSVGTFQKIRDVDISRFTRPGKNQLTVDWKGSKRPFGSVDVGEQVGGKWRKVANLELRPSANLATTRQVAFVVGGGKTAGAVNPARPGSQARQALLTVNLSQGRGTVSINGKKVGDYEVGLVPLDVSDYVRKGANELQISWKKGTNTYGSVDVGWAEEANRFRSLGQIKLQPPLQGTSRKVTFTVP